MIVKLNGEYTTASGLPVRIYAVDGENLYPIHGAVHTRDHGWVGTNWTKEGLWAAGAIAGAWELKEVLNTVVVTYTYKGSTKQIDRLMEILQRRSSGGSSTLVQDVDFTRTVERS